MIDDPNAFASGTTSASFDGFAMQPGELPAVPIVLGVIGHRDVPVNNRRAVSEQLRWVFREFRKKEDPRTPVVLLSGLAEGADQLAAEAALACGIHVRAVLPFPRKAYRKSTSFSSEEARRKLDELLDDPRVESIVTLHPDGTLPKRPRWMRVAVERHDSALKNLRYACYANVGGYIVRHSHALIAIWDSRGEDPNRPSGTASHVRFKLVGQAPSHYQWVVAEPLGFRSERGLVLSIHSPKTGAIPDQESPSPGALRILMPDFGEKPGTLGWRTAPEEWNVLIAREVPAGDRFWDRVRTSLGKKQTELSKAQAELTQFREICQSIRDFNRDIASDDVSEPVRRRLVKNAASHDVPQFDPEMRAWFRRFCRVREGAAGLSEQMRPTVDGVSAGLFMVIAISATMFHFYAHWSYEEDPLRHNPIWLWVFSICIFIAILLVAGDWWARLDLRRLDARALGEGLRVRRAWAKAGIGRSVADSYAGQLRSEFSWVRNAMMHICPPPKFWSEQFNKLPEATQLQLLREVHDEWVGGTAGQAKQYQKSHQKQHELAITLRPFGFFLALGGWFLAAAMLFPGPSFMNKQPGPERIQPATRQPQAAPLGETGGR